MTSPRLSEETGRVLGGRYRLVAPVGVGTSARVFLAVDTQLRRRVAVKLLHEALSEDESFLRRFRAEARAAGALSHPNIVAVFDWGEDRSGDVVIPYLVTEYLGGGSLRDMLDRSGRLSPSQALMIGLDTSRALAHAHLRGLVHRDVKPGNLLFDEEGRLRLADFGLARALAEASWTEPTDTTFGAARYASPEQALGRRLDGRSDVYSLALVLAECVIGDVPFTGDTTMSTLTLRTQQDLTLGPEFGGIRSALERAGTMDPDERPEAAEFEIALMAAAESLPRPGPLPIVATLGDGEHTSEMYLGRGLTNVAPVDLAPAGSDHAEAAGDPSTTGAPDVVPDSADSADNADNADSADSADSGEDTEFIDLSEYDDAEVVLNMRDRERGPIDVAQEYELLAASRPVSFGRIVTDDSDRLPPHHLSAPPGDDLSVRPRRGWRRPVVVIVVLALLLGAGAGWWFLVRVPTHDVPDFVGENIEQVTARAVELGWLVDDDTVDRRDGSEPGDVLEQTPPSGERLAEGETLTLVVSLGATLTPMVDVAGSEEAAARSAITDGGLVVGDVSTAHDEEVAEGSVISAAPAPGGPTPDEQSMVPKGTVIDLVVSDGPAPRAVPDDLIGAALNDAKGALADLQLETNVLEEHSEEVVAGFVIRADPDSGEVARGSTVTLVVSSGPAPVAVPDVRFNTGTAAVATLESQGFAVAGIEGSPSGMVLATDPVAGELVPKGTSVRIFTRS